MKNDTPRRPAGSNGRALDKKLRALGFEPVRGKKHLIYRGHGGTLTVGTAPTQHECHVVLSRAEKLREGT